MLYYKQLDKLSKRERGEKMNMNLYWAALAAKGYTQYQLARVIGVSESTLIRKLKMESFSLREVKRIMDVLEISDPRPIFFN